MTDTSTELSELLAQPSDKLSPKQYAEKLIAVETLTRNSVGDSVGAVPHSTRELNMMAALAHPVYKEDGVPDYVDEVVMLDQRESPLQTAEQIVGFYRDAITNVRDIIQLIHELDETGDISVEPPGKNNRQGNGVKLAALATIRRHEDTMLFIASSDQLNLYIDDDYSQMDNVAYAKLLMAGDDRSHVTAAIQETLIAEQDRAAFWLSQITGSIHEVDDQQITRKGLVDSASAEVRSYIAQLSGRKSKTAEVNDDTDVSFAVGKRPEIGDNKAWERFLHRNRLFDVRFMHGFLPLSNKEARKVKNFDRLKNDPDEILRWMDMINESNRRDEVAKGKSVDPKRRLDALVGRFDEYATDAADNVIGTEFILSAIDEKSDESALFKDSFPAEEWFLDYPEHTLPFTRLVEFLQTEDFIENGFVDTITDRARAKNRPSLQDEIDEIMNGLGNVTLRRVAEITERYAMDQTNRFNYWKGILEITKAHGSAAPVVHQALFKLATKAPRYTLPDDPVAVIHPTTTKEIPF